MKSQTYAGLPRITVEPGHAAHLLRMVEHGERVMEGALQMQFEPFSYDVGQTGSALDTIVETVIETVEAVVLGRCETVAHEGAYADQYPEMLSQVYLREKRRSAAILSLILFVRNVRSRIRH